MNNDGKASLSSSETSEARKIVLTDNILPDCLMFEEAFNKYFIPFCKYETGDFECIAFKGMIKVFLYSIK
jgi:hypothetical protein